MKVKNFLSEFIRKGYDNEMSRKDLEEQTLKDILPYNMLRIKAGLGQGAPASTPVLGFLAEDNKMSDGIYPVYLFYKKEGKVILAYGVSETNTPKAKWNKPDATLVDDWFKNNYGYTPKHYGYSRVFSVYDAEHLPEEDKLTRDLITILEEYAEHLKQQVNIDVKQNMSKADFEYVATHKRSTTSNDQTEKTTIYKAGEYYNFIALNIFEDTNGMRYIALSDGSGRTNKVRPYEFQTEWSEILGTRIRCYCKAIGRFGNPMFEQDHYAILSSLYNGEGEEKEFKVMSEMEVDSNTGARYYNLQDVYGIGHRYYTDAKYDRFEEIVLKVMSIGKKDNNRAYLELRPKDEVIVEVKHNSDILKVSKFGQEDQENEFKSTIVFPPKSDLADIRKQLGQICRTLAAFMNTDGGTLYIGVNDNGQVCGIENDIPHLNDDEEDDYTYQLNCDGYEQKIRWSVIRLLGQTAASALHFKFKKEESKIYCIITVDKADKPVYFNEIFTFVRQGNMSLLLKGEALTDFMLKRLSLSKDPCGTNPITTPNDSKITVGDDVDTKEKINVNNTEVNVETNEPVDFYISFYADGGWSYQDNEKDDAIWNVPVTKSQRRDKTSRLVQIYDNGYMNAVSINDIRQKTKGRLEPYSNGWNTEACLINAFCASVHDQIAFFSKDEDNHEWVKVHYASCVNCVASMKSKGNIIIHTRFNNAKITYAQQIGQQYNHLVSSVCCNDNETTKKIGVKTKDPKYSAPVGLLKKLCNLD